MPHLLYHLRCQVLWGATDRKRLVITLDVAFRQTEVSQLDVAVRTDQYILWLQAELK